MYPSHEVAGGFSRTNSTGSNDHSTNWETLDDGGWPPAGGDRQGPGPTSDGRQAGYDQSFEEMREVPNPHHHHHHHHQLHHHRGDLGRE